MSEEQMRAEFEAWAIGRHLDVARWPLAPDNYASLDVQNVWNGWRAARSHPVAAEPVGGVPDGWKLVPVKIADAMIEAAYEAHYGKRRVRAAGGASGIDMAVNDRNYTGVDAMRRMWPAMLAASPSPAGAHEAKGDDTRRLDWLQETSCDLRSINLPTGGDDYEIGWRVIEHHEAKPHEREIGFSANDDLRAAIDAAMLPADARKEGV